MAGPARPTDIAPGSTTASASTSSSPSGPRLPLTKYSGDLALLTFLLINTTLFVPRSSSLFGKTIPLSQRSSADRPEHPFLTPLTADPQRTMIWEVVGTGVVMIWWGTRLRRWWSPPSTTDQQSGQGKKGNSSSSSGAQRSLYDSLVRTGRAGVMTLLASIVIVPLLMALGAPLDEFLIHTWLLALHLSFLLVYPVIYTLGIPSLDHTGLFARYRLIKLLCELRTDNPLEKTITCPYVGTLIGAWLGAFVIPLDWDRPWQSWPLTPTIGASLGFLIGGYASWAQSAYASSVDQPPKEEHRSPPKKKSRKGKKD